jgi:hypothetical protein
MLKRRKHEPPRHVSPATAPIRATRFEANLTQKPIEDNARGSYRAIMGRGSVTK